MTVTAPSADAAPDTHRVYRVVQWAAGRIGLSAMRAIIRNPGLDLDLKDNGWRVLVGGRRSRHLSHVGNPVRSGPASSDSACGLRDN